MLGPASIAGTGVALGILHVLTGPDHLSALATLSANDGNALWLGIRWGVGHSAGLLIAGLVLLVVLDAAEEEDKINVPKSISHCFEGFVGVFMILLGIYGVLRALRKDRTDDQDGRDKDTSSPLFAEKGVRLSYINEAENQASDDTLSPTSNDEETENFQDEHPHDHFHSCCPDWLMLSFCETLASRIPARLAAILVGVVHGFAGPGGVLGVLPAVQIRNVGLGSLYLGSFCMASTITMGLFALVYGRLSQKVGSLSPKWALRTELVSALLSAIVGVIWLVALASGIFDEFLD